MKKSLLTLVLIGTFLAANVTAQPSVPSQQQQVDAALQAAPQSLQAGAKVYGYDRQGEWTTLREGNNALICLADDPQKSDFHVACYHSALEPFMKRGRELRRQGLTRQEVDEKRAEEVENGTLSLPEKAMTVYNLSGKEGAYDYESGTLQNARPLTAIYIPFATEESTGMSTSPAGPGAPWLMEAGTPWAHIMIPGQPRGQSAAK